MKKLLLFTIPALALLLASCGGGSSSQTPSSEAGPSDQSQETSGGQQEESSSVDPDDHGDKNLKIIFYLDYNHYDEENPYYVGWWYLDRAFTKADIGLTDPATVPDEYYDVFLGWSTYTIVDDNDKLWNFGTDTVSYEMTAGNTIEMFGIFVRR